MSSPTAEVPGAGPGAGPGVPRAVLAAAGCFVLGAGAVAIALRLHQRPPSGILLIGWPVFALAGGLLLDQQRSPALGRVLCGFAFVPLVVLGLASAFSSGPADAADVLHAVAGSAALQVVALGVLIPLAARPVRQRRGLAAGVVLIAVGAGVSGAGAAAWGPVVVALAAFWGMIAVEARRDARMERRRIAWLMAVLAAGGAAVLVGWAAFPPGVACYLTAAALALVALGVTRACLTEVFRPLDEYLLDLALVAGVAAGAAVVALLVRVGAVLTNLPSPNVSAAFAGLLTAATAVPAAAWVRRAVLARRYGLGSISPADVAVITADLGSATDPRELLGKAARMVASAGGCRDARLVLGEEVPEVTAGWALHPLDVGGERVGSLAVRSGGPEGPEPRQAEVIARLIPTVALVARAVGLAVEAELARRDVARERDLERRRILADLHDGLGPVLAGMSMRVRAALRADGSSELLSDLADGLARSRTDLRRIVAGISPSALDDGDLKAALEHLVESFRGSGGPIMILDVELIAPVAEAAQVTVYRCVAEGVTNALRHARASSIAIRVASAPEVVQVDVTDDGSGGRIVPGVGLSSLFARAERLGGSLLVGPAHPSGTRLRLELPA